MKGFAWHISGKITLMYPPNKPQVHINGKIPLILLVYVINDRHA
jgi:hypothetical protein